jgi:hypothetical protein
MRQKIRAHLTYANVMGTIAVFMVLGGTTYAATGGNFILGQSNTASSTTGLSAGTTGPAFRVTNTSTGTAGSFNVAAGHPPLTVNSATKVANLNADKLDGLDSTGFIRGQGRIDSIDGLAASGDFVDLFSLSNFLYVRGVCNGTSANGEAQVWTHNSPVDMLLDNGGTDPIHVHINANSAVTTATNPSGESLTFSFESSGKVATAFVFSYTFHNPVLNEDECQYQGHVIVKGA